jgi:nitrite reductase/ring-hydroxylating ferredoxin subunit
MDRRKFLTLATGAYLGAARCPLLAGSNAEQIIDAGPVSNFSADGVYDTYRALGFFIVRKEGRLFALSSYCTHRQVTLTAERNCTFYCKRHGSTFDATGHVTKGPASKDMPVLSMSTNSVGHLVVSVRG